MNAIHKAQPKLFAHQYRSSSRERGYVLVAVVMLAAICLMVSVNMLNSAMSSSSTRFVVNKNHDNYYEVEHSVNKVAAWLQANSSNLVSAFKDDQFNDHFDLGTPSIGSNEGAHFAVPTLVKMKGTNNSVMLSNDAYFGTSAFPSTTNIDTGAAFNPISAFQSADFGGASARVIMIWARVTDGNYEPMFRVDAITGGSPERGIHGVNYLRSQLVTSNSNPGFFGRDSLSTNNPNNECYSYMWTWSGATWVRGAQRSNCALTSAGNIHIGSRINGDVRTTADGGVSMGAQGAVSGEVCQGSGCHSYALPPFNSYASYCPSNLGDVVGATGAGTVLNAGIVPTSTQCYRDIGIGSNRTVRFAPGASGKVHTFYVRNLDLHNNGDLRFTTLPPDEKYVLYIDVLNGNGHVNGNQIVNDNLAPWQLEINLINQSTLTLNGTAQMRAAITAPTATVNVLGNFTFYGSIRANQLHYNGNAVMGFDEALGSAPIISDLRFSLFKASQRYR